MHVVDTQCVAEHCDSIIIGDAEPVWENVMEDAKGASLKRYTQVQPEYLRKCHNKA